MARKRRSCPAGQIFHLCNRATHGVTLFENPFDYLQVLRVIQEALEKFPVLLYAYCIMPNHWHLLVQPRIPGAISRFMHWFGTTHAARYRKSHETSGQGAVYQNRFRSHPVQGSQAFFKTVAYIERNAWAAGLAPSAPSWPWSSISSHAVLRVDPWPFPKPRRWIQRVAEPLQGAILRQIHHSEISANPLETCLPVRPWPRRSKVFPPPPKPGVPPLDRLPGHSNFANGKPWLSPKVACPEAQKR